MKAFYACDNGKDYLAELKDKSKTIWLTELPMGRKIGYDFMSAREAQGQYYMWIRNSDLRMPITFYVTVGADREALKFALAQLGYAFPDAGDLRKYIIYHQGAHELLITCVDNFDNQYMRVIPEIPLSFLRKVNRGPRTVKHRTQLAGGFL